MVQSSEVSLLVPRGGKERFLSWALIDEQLFSRRPGRRKQMMKNLSSAFCRAAAVWKILSVPPD